MSFSCCPLARFFYPTDNHLHRPTSAPLNGLHLLHTSKSNHPKDIHFHEPTATFPNDLRLLQPYKSMRPKDNRLREPIAALSSMSSKSRHHAGILTPWTAILASPLQLLSKYPRSCCPRHTRCFLNLSKALFTPCAFSTITHSIGVNSSVNHLPHVSHNTPLVAKTQPRDPRLFRLLWLFFFFLVLSPLSSGRASLLPCLPCLVFHSFHHRASRRTPQSQRFFFLFFFNFPSQRAALSFLPWRERGFCAASTL